LECHPERRSEPRLRGEGKRGISVLAGSTGAAGKNPGPSTIFFAIRAKEDCSG